MRRRDGDEVLEAAFPSREPCSPDGNDSAVGENVRHILHERRPLRPRYHLEHCFGGRGVEAEGSRCAEGVLASGHRQVRELDLAGLRIALMKCGGEMSVSVGYGTPDNAKLATVVKKCSITLHVVEHGRMQLHSYSNRFASSTRPAENYHVKALAHLIERNFCADPFYAPVDCAEFLGGVIEDISGEF